MILPQIFKTNTLAGKILSVVLYFSCSKCCQNNGKVWTTSKISWNMTDKVAMKAGAEVNIIRMEKKEWHLEYYILVKTNILKVLIIWKGRKDY